MSNKKCWIISLYIVCTLNNDVVLYYALLVSIEKCKTLNESNHLVSFVKTLPSLFISVRKINISFIIYETFHQSENWFCRLRVASWFYSIYCFLSKNWGILLFNIIKLKWTEWTKLYYDKCWISSSTSFSSNPKPLIYTCSI